MRSQLVAILFIGVLSLSSRDALSVQISGNHLYSSKELAGFINFNAPNDSIESKIESLYKDAGYFNARVEHITDNRTGEKAITIVEGAPAMIDSIHIELVPASNTTNFNDIGLEIKRQVASKEKFEDFGAQCIRRLAESGMPFANGQWPKPRRSTPSRKPISARA